MVVSPSRPVRLLAALVVTSSLVTVGAAAASAYPGQDDVRRAQAAVTAKAAGVAALQVRLDAGAARVDAAETALSVATEDYDEAQLNLAAATTHVVSARAASALATAKLTAARAEVGRIAAAAYRDGGRTGTLDAVLSGGGPQEVLDRASAIRGVAQRRQQFLKQVDATRLVATAAEHDAAAALLEQTAAADAVTRARTAAQQRASAARSAQAAQLVERAGLLAELAAARRTSVSVETARQAGLAEDLRRAQEARALAQSRAAARRATAARPSGAVRTRSVPSSSSPSDPPPAPAASGGSGSAAVSWARTKVGLPYLWGGDGPGSYDCSGLTMRAWEQQGVSLPHSSRVQYTQSQKVSYDDMRVGDLIFYATDPSDASTIHHVTLYAGGGMMVEAPQTGLDVRVVPVRWGDAMPFAARP